VFLANPNDFSRLSVCVCAWLFCWCLQVLNGDVTRDNLDGIIRSIAAALSVDPSLVEIIGVDARRQISRRAPVSITFRLFVHADKQNAISAIIESESFSNNLAMELDRQNIQATVASTGPFPVISLVGMSC